MTRPPHFLSRLLRWCSAPVFLLMLALAIRTACIGTYDTLRFGQGNAWHCDLHISIGNLNLGGQSYAPAYARYGKGPGWFWEHHRGISGNAAWGIEPGIEYHSLRKWGPFQSGHDLLGPAEVRYYYWLNLGPLPLILLVASACILTPPVVRTANALRASCAGLCPKCHYDLRAHKPGEKCPECGTPKPTPTGITS